MSSDHVDVVEAFLFLPLLLLLTCAAVGEDADDNDDGCAVEDVCDATVNCVSLGALVAVAAVGMCIMFGRAVDSSVSDSDSLPMRMTLRLARFRNDFFVGSV